MRRYGEGEIHEKEKERIGAIISTKGWTVYVDTYEFKIPGHEHPYIPDVYAENFCEVKRTQPQSIQLFSKLVRGEIKDRELQNRGRRIILEVQGPGGHNTKLAYDNERRRLANIRETYGSDIEYYEVWLSSDIDRRRYRARSKTNLRSNFDVRTWTAADILTHVRIT